MRWRIQLDALDIRVPLPPLVWSIFGTYAVNLLAPRLGELWRTGYIAKRQDAKFTTVFGSMVCDRLADTATVLLLTLVTFLSPVLHLWRSVRNIRRLIRVCSTCYIHHGYGGLQLWV